MEIPEDLITMGTEDEEEVTAAYIRGYEDGRSQDEILLAVAEGKIYESEYDGRVTTYCAYCDTPQEGYTDHDGDCPMVLARKALGAVWDARAKVVEEEEARKRSFMFNGRVPSYNDCSLCGRKNISKWGMEQHQSSARCKRNRQRVE